MADLKDGGAAFPESYVGDESPHEGIGAGMTMRQYYFARLVPEMLRAGVHERGVCEAAWKLAGQMVVTSKG